MLKFKVTPGTTVVCRVHRKPRQDRIRPLFFDQGSETTRACTGVCGRWGDSPKDALIYTNTLQHYSETQTGLPLGKSEE